jgi:cytochrome bd ubiquinol oxidase subunit I
MMMPCVITLLLAETTTSAASHGPLISRSVVIGLFSLLHIALAAPAVALMVLAPIAEHAGIRRPFLTDVARTMTRFTVATFAASSVLAVFMIELFVGLFPLTNTWLFHQFRLPLYLGSAAFLLMTVALLAYFFWWDAIRTRSVRLHILLGAVAAAFVVLWAAVLDGIGSYMLTPVVSESTWGHLLNATWIPLVLHRFGGDVATAGYLAAAYAAWMLGRRTGHPDEPYYLHFFKLAFGVGLLGLLLQPLTGLLYAVLIERTVPQAYEQLISGRYQGWVSLQFVLVGALFVGSHGLLTTGAPVAGRSRWREGLLITSAILMVLFAGAPNIRRAFTFLLVGLTLWHVIAWRHQLIAVGPQQLNRLSIRLTASLLAVLSLLTYLTMGIIRETARRPDIVRGQISLQDETRTPAAFRD